MTRWQKRARFAIGVFAVAFAVFVVLAFRRQPRTVEAPKVVMPDKAIAVSTSGRLLRYKATRQDVDIQYEQHVTYKDGISKLLGIKVTSTNRADGRTFVVTAKEGQAHENPARYTLDGAVTLVANDGLTAKTEHATYEESDGTVRASGPVEFGKGRMSGTGVGMTYDKARDALSIREQAIVHVDADEKGAGASNVTSGSATFARPEKQVRFERDVKLQRGGETFEAENATAYLTQDEKRIDTVELRGASRVRASKREAGNLQGLSGRDMNLKYADDGQSLQHLLIVGDAVVQIAGGKGMPGRQLMADVIDCFVAADGQTPTALAGRDNVRLTFPAEAGSAARTIRAKTIDAVGQQGRGLTNAHFSGDVEYREQSATVDRSAKAPELDIALKPGMSSIEEAKFAGGARFTDGKMAATASVAKYVLDKGRLELSGSESAAGAAAPHVVNEQIGIDAAAIDITLAGPYMYAAGNVKSLLQPATKSGQKSTDAQPDVKPDVKGVAKAATKMPSMLKQDQPVNVLAETLEYDGEASTATYSGGVRLFQGDTTIIGDDIVVDDKSGDLTASGSVTTRVILEQVKKGSGAAKTKERVASIGTADAFNYEEKERRATYTGNAHINGPEGDITAARIELYLKSSGNELERAEAYGLPPDTVTLRESARKTNAAHVSYFAADDRYVATGTPVIVVDECNYETKGRTLTFTKATDTIVVDGQKQFRTSTQGSGKCPGSPD